MTSFVKIPSFFDSVQWHCAYSNFDSLLSSQNFVENPMTEINILPIKGKFTRYILNLSEFFVLIPMPFRKFDKGT